MSLSTVHGTEMDATTLCLKKKQHWCSTL